MTLPQIQSFATEPRLAITQKLPAVTETLYTDQNRFQTFLDESYPAQETPVVQMNIVHTKDFRLTDDNNSSFGISSALDRRILRHIRKQADAVFMGAATIRNEGWVLPKTGAPAAILVGHTPLELPDVEDISCHGPDFPIYLFASKKVFAEQKKLSKRARGVFQVSDDLQTAVSELIDTMRTEGFPHLICEGGVVVAEAALSKQLIDEIDVTISPLESSGQVKISTDYADGYTLVQEFSSEDGFIFQRWRRASADQASH